MSSYRSEPEQALKTSLRLLLRARALGFSNVYTFFWVLILTQDLHASIPRALQVVSLGTLIGGLLDIPTGWLADKFGRWLSLVAGAICCSIGLSLYATA